MPGIIADPFVVGVLPRSLSTKFTSSNAYESRITEYHDGTTERGVLVGSGRRKWSMSKRLTPAEAATLRAWFDAHEADAFYFYDLRETVPAYTYDASGAATSGRYTVRVASDWAESIGIPRSDMNMELIEIGGATGGGVIPGSVPSYWHGTPTGAVLYFVTSHIPGTGYTGTADVTLGSTRVVGGGAVMYDGSAWTLRTDASTWSPGGAWGGPIGPLYAPANPLNTLVNFFIFGSLAGSASPPDIFRIHDCYMDVTFTDGAIVRYRPSSATAILGAYGTIANPQNAIGGNISTYCEIDQSTFGTGFAFPQLILKTWVLSS